MGPKWSFIDVRRSKDTGEGIKAKKWNIMEMKGEKNYETDKEGKGKGKVRESEGKGKEKGRKKEGKGKGKGREREGKGKGKRREREREGKGKGKG